MLLDQIGDSRLRQTERLFDTFPPLPIVVARRNQLEHFLSQLGIQIRPKLVCTLGNWATQTLLERKVGITKVKAQAFYMKDFVLFPLLHPAAALHQGNLLDTLKEDFKKKNTKPAESTNTASPAAPTLQIDPPNPAQMDLFG
ncbi:MAG: hypothetical protein HP490_03100 [Nitrospira sp.]|nr:hypothetical protein [Nitrospira sp.]